MKRNTKLLMILPILSTLLFITSTSGAYSQTADQTSRGDNGDYKIPSWIKNNARWWAAGEIGDGDFLKGIEYLINQSIIMIPQVEPTTTATQGIPSWIKNNAQLWAADEIGDGDFVKGLEYLVANNIIHVNMKKISLLFVQYPSPSDTPTVRSLMHQHLSLPSDYIQVEKNNLYHDFPNQRKLIVADSLAGINYQINRANNIGIPIYAITYDFEHWIATPDSEKEDPFGSMIVAANAVHNAGYKFAYAPDSKFLNDNYKAYDWKKVDVAWLQVGYNARKYSNYEPFITDVINTIKTKNPNAIIIVQLSLLVMSDPTISDPAAQFNKEVDIAVKLKADAISVVYLNPSKSPYFTIPNLEKILSHIATLRK